MTRTEILHRNYTYWNSKQKWHTIKISTQKWYTWKFYTDITCKFYTEMTHTWILHRNSTPWNSIHWNSTQKWYALEFYTEGLKRTWNLFFFPHRVNSPVWKLQWVRTKSESTLSKYVVNHSYEGILHIERTLLISHSERPCAISPTMTLEPEHNVYTFSIRG